MAAGALNSILERTQTMAQKNPPNRAPKPAGADPMRVDPSDARLYARRMQEAKRLGPLAKFFRYAAIALVLVGGFAAFWNFETLIQLRLDFSELTSLFGGDERRNADGTPVADGDLATEVVEAAGVAGVGLPSSIDGEPTEPEAEAVAAREARSGTETVAVVSPPPAATAAPAPAATGAPASAEAPPPPVEEPPAGPEIFGFGLITRMSVSEADASAAVLVLREGGRRGVSTITWWTTDDTAKAGTDYVSFDTRVERFASGEQNRTLRVPIVGDRNTEGPESFYVHIAPGDTGRARESVAKIEVVINDDD